MDWLSVKQKITYKVLILIYNIVSTKNDECVFKKEYKNMYYVKNIDVHNINTRQANKFHMTQQNNKS
jgi:hypothetical protein